MYVCVGFEVTLSTVQCLDF